MQKKGFVMALIYKRFSIPDGFYPIKNYENLYGISKNAEVFSVLSGKCIKFDTNSGGYFRVVLCD